MKISLGKQKGLLKNQLDIPDFIVEPVGGFVDTYLEQVLAL